MVVEEVDVDVDVDVVLDEVVEVEVVLVFSSVVLVVAAVVVEAFVSTVSGGAVCSTGSLPPHPQRTMRQTRNVCLMRIYLKVHDPCDTCQKTVAGLRRGRVKVWVFRINW